MFSVAVVLAFNAVDDGFTLQMMLGEDVEQDRSTMPLNPFKEDRFRPTVPEPPVLTSTSGI